MSARGVPSAECMDDPSTPGIDTVSDDGWTAIAGASSAVYAPEPTDVGRCLRATAMYTDNVGRIGEQATGVLEVPVGRPRIFCHWSGIGQRVCQCPARVP